MLGVSEDLERTGEVKEVHVVVHCDEHLDGLIDIGLTNCTHLDGLEVVASE